ncbi:hypothetical protein AAG593_06865 [Citromicrobium bathyomarinum]|uniref:hypothetical protein n=1 Tax=unclassified Citromicrobium TaxID=2630544 RepID=UPI0006C90FF0|nr:MULTISPECIES: hypothetical protein [unclassified Citromicrobium]MAO05103.1 hypothetical protein [Citromicrobium sp.]MEC8179567.1 hypothetical protein [Pseudomonadota bacterium]KPM25344.1 hypothetical protein AAJ72_06670 [Citromicrobium sp. RCC1885]KPM28585.1 hypothetical protein AAJ74_07410 [Citromicrobium sp. RCC1878]OAM09874.1 hypothetical protein A0U43_02000 [Citromicrobium sp. RCC1897]|tara:strand:- start:7 stop:195 length:189 start_codon:yes stop_codon:yes gene_type:complete
MSDKQTNNQALGIAFLMMGVGLSISLGLTLDPAFLGAGLPFVVVGIVFLSKSKAGAVGEGDR